MRSASIRAYVCLAALWWSCGANENPKPEMAVRLAVKTSAPGLMPPPDKTSPPDPLSHAGEAQAQGKVELRVVRTRQGVGVRVINAGSEPLSLAAQVGVSAVPGTGAQVQAGQALTLQRGCATQGCVNLAPGTELDAPAWLERVAGERCGALLMPATAGSYRLGVQTCGGKPVADVEFVWPIQ